MRISGTGGISGMAGVLLLRSMQTCDKITAERTVFHSCRNRGGTYGDLSAIHIGMGDETAGEFYTDDDAFCSCGISFQVLQGVRRRESKGDFMKKSLLYISVLLPVLLLFTGCGQESHAAVAGYEFLTPQVLVLKNPKPYVFTSHPVSKQGLWQKENALLRDNNGNILRKPDITVYGYYILEKPLKDGEKVSIAGNVVQYDSAVPSNIFKLNQVGNGLKQKKKFAYMGAWLGSLGALPLKYLAGKDFETIDKEIREYKANTTALIFCLESMNNLANNGRVKPAVAAIASILGIRAIGDVDEGGLHPTDKVRGEKKATSTIFANMKKMGYKGGKLIIDHAFNTKAANALKDMTLAEFPNAEVRVEETRGLCTFYAEKGGLIIGFEREL